MSVDEKEPFFFFMPVLGFHSFANEQAEGAFAAAPLQFFLCLLA